MERNEKISKKKAYAASRANTGAFEWSVTVWFVDERAISVKFKENAKILGVI